MKKILDNQQVIDQKNALLQPIFRDLKSKIRHMTFSPEFELMREYLMKRRELISATKGRIGEEELEGALKELQLNYAKLLSLRQRKIKFNLNLRV
jgi:hypothetical protein